MDECHESAHFVAGNLHDLVKPDRRVSRVVEVFLINPAGLAHTAPR